MERLNASCTNALRASLDDEEDWVSMLPVVQALQNSHVHNSTGFTPHMMMYNREKRLPEEEWGNFDILDQDPMMSQEEVDNFMEINEHTFPSRHLDYLKGVQERIFRDASENIKSATLRTKRNFDKKHVGRIEIAPGDLVLKENTKNRQRKGGKLDELFSGPYRVVDYDPKKANVRLESMKGKILKRRVPTDQIKKFTPREEDKENCADDSDPGGSQDSDEFAAVSQRPGPMAEFSASSLNAEQKSRLRNDTAQEVPNLMSSLPSFTDILHSRAGDDEEPDMSDIGSDDGADDAVYRYEENSSPDSDWLPTQPLSDSDDSGVISFKLPGQGHSMDDSDDSGVISFKPHPDTGRFSLNTTEEDTAQHDDTAQGEDTPQENDDPDWAPSKEDEEEEEEDTALLDDIMQESYQCNATKFKKSLKRSVSQGMFTSAAKKKKVQQSQPLLNVEKTSMLKQLRQPWFQRKLTESQCIDLAKQDSLMAAPVREQRDEIAQDLDSSVDSVEFLFAKEVEEIPIFNVLSSQTRLQICREQNIPVDREVLYRETSWPGAGIGHRFSIKGPRGSIHVDGDGACFFRSVSWILTGSEDQHPLLRRKVCSFIKNKHNWHLLKAKCAPYSCGAAYVRDQNMLNDKKWATEVELFAMAHLLGYDILVYHVDTQRKQCRWIPFRASGNSAISSDSALFILNKNNFHFEPIVLL